MLLISQIDTSDNDIIRSWRQAAFSGLSDVTLARYFNDQLEGIAARRDPLRQAELLALVDHLWQYYACLLDPAKPAPAAYRQRLLNQLTSPLEQVRAICAQQQPFLAYLDSICDPGAEKPFSYSTLHYFDALVNALAAGEEPGTVFIQWNFNHLAYLAQQQRALEIQLQRVAETDRYAWLACEKARIAALPERRAAAYDPSWPSLKVMLVGWLTEKLSLQPLSAPRPAKLTLDLSVAQLACLLRLAYEEEIFKEENVSAILRFVCDHFSAKRQTDITPGGLAKAYYGTEQVTAAVVLDRLQQLYQRLKRNFFPA